MRQQTMQKVAASTSATFGKGFKFAAATAAVIVMIVFGAGTAAAATPQSVDVVNTPTVHVGNTPSVTVANTPSVSVANTPSVNVANTPSVSISGTPTVNAHATITMPGPLTNVGRLASQQVNLYLSPNSPCQSGVQQISPGAGMQCFDMANHPSQVLIITDLFWFGNATSGSTCILYLVDPTSNLLFSAGVVGATDGFFSKDEHLTTGVNLTVNPHTAYSGSCSVSYAQVQGYLVPNQ